MKANALGMLHDMGHKHVKTADAVSWANTADEIRPPKKGQS